MVVVGEILSSWAERAVQGVEAAKEMIRERRSIEIPPRETKLDLELFDLAFWSTRKFKCLSESIWHSVLESLGIWSFFFLCPGFLLIAENDRGSSVRTEIGILGAKKS